MKREKLNIPVVKLGSGKESIPIYQNHPHTHMYVIYQRTSDKLNEVGEQYGVAKRYESFDELIQDQNVDAIKSNSPIYLHGSQSIADLNAGKSVACARNRSAGSCAVRHHDASTPDGQVSEYSYRPFD